VSLITLIIVLVVVGVVLWLINTYIPMEAGIKRLLNIAVIIVTVIWLLKATGLFSALSSVTV
jgi:hypothetical protein